jgi:small subunit ribosomal protein S5
MSETKNEQAEIEQIEQLEVSLPEALPVEAAAVTEQPRGDFRGGRRDNRQRQGGRPNRQRRQEPDDGFDTRLIKVRRVSRMYKGGRRMRLSVFIVAGDRNGRVGLGLGKGQDVAQAQTKAVLKAKKNLVMASLKGNTIPHEIEVKYKSSRLILKPAAPGTGIIAGSTVKGVLELAGVKDALTKILGSTNQINAAYATIEALRLLRSSRL